MATLIELVLSGPAELGLEGPAKGVKRRAGGMNMLYYMHSSNVAHRYATLMHPWDNHDTLLLSPVHSYPFPFLWCCMTLAWQCTRLRISSCADASPATFQRVPYHTGYCWELTSCCTALALASRGGTLGCCIALSRCLKLTTLAGLLVITILAIGWQ